MVVVAVVSGTTDPERVVLAAARQADERETRVHALYVYGLGWVANRELAIGERVGIPTGIETIRTVAERNAERVADPILDEYEVAAVVGEPIEEIVDYAQEVDADCVVLAAGANWGASVSRLYRSPVEQLRERDPEFDVVPVY